MRTCLMIAAILVLVSSGLQTQKLQAQNGLAPTTLPSLLVDSMSSKQLMELMKSKGYAVTTPRENTLLWMVDGYKVVLTCRGGGNSIIFHVGFTNNGNTTLQRVNLWNRTVAFSRSYLDDDGDPCLETDLDLSGGITEDRVADFLMKSKVCFMLWRNTVVK